MNSFKWFKCYPGDLLGALAEMPPSVGYVYVVILMRIYEGGGPCRDTVDALSKRTHLNRKAVWDAVQYLVNTGRLKREADGSLINPRASLLLSESKKLKTAFQKGAEETNKKIKSNQQNSCRLADAVQVPGAVESEKRDKKKEEKKEERDLFADANRPPAPPAPSTEPDPVGDLRTQLFRDGTRMLARMTGKAEPQARSIIGRWLKQCGDEAGPLFWIIQDAEQNRVIDAVAWITKALVRRAEQSQPRAKPRNGFVALQMKLMEARAGNVTTDQDYAASDTTGHQSSAVAVVEVPYDRQSRPPRQSRFAPVTQRR